MTRKDYVKFAEAVKCANVNEKERARTAKLIAEVCKSENGRFSFERFYEACGVAEKVLS